MRNVKSPALVHVLADAERVQRAARSLLGSIGIEQPRMIDLRDRVGLDKSVASRTARAIRSKDAGSALRELPGTEMLRRLVARCAELGADSTTVTEANEAVDRLDASIAAFPGDRTALVAAIAGTAAGAAPGVLPVVSEAKLRAARRGAYNALLIAQGISCETTACITILAPGSKPGLADQAMVISTTGLRRLRAGHPYALLSLQGRHDTNEGFDRTTLAGEPVLDDPSVAMIPDFCSPAASQLRLERRGRFHSLVLDPKVPPLDEPMDMAYGVINPNFTSCQASSDRQWSMTSYTVSRPCRIHVREVLLHRATYRGCVPEATFSIETVPMARIDQDGPDRSGRGGVDHGAEFVAMGPGYQNSGRQQDDFAVPLALRAFKMLGKDPADFDRFRMVVEYPLPFVRGEVWLRLPGGG